MPGFEKVLRGILKYRKNVRPQLMERLKELQEQATPEPKTLMFSCMDTRVMTTKLLQADDGEMFIIRNPGNLVPHSTLFNQDHISPEPGALEFAVLHTDCKHVFVCGHSDCKGMQALYNLPDKSEDGALHMWVRRHASATLTRYEELLVHGTAQPLTFKIEPHQPEVKAFIDPDNKLAEVDRLSQVNTLQQLHNIASYSFLREKLDKKELKLLAMWFDVHTGNFYIFSRKQCVFVEITEDSVPQLLDESQLPLAC